MKLNTLIVDDEYAGRNSLLHLLKTHCDTYIDSIDTSSSVNDAEFKIQSNQYHIIFLDIQLNIKSGFDLIGKISDVTKIIFVTAYSEYALTAIKNRAYDYFLKPVDPFELKAVVKKCHYQFQQSVKQFLTIKYKGLTVPLELSAIVFLKAKGPYSEIHELGGKIYVTSQTLKALESKLSKQFMRVHKSYIVNSTYIQGFNQKELFVNKICIPVSRFGLVVLQQYYLS